MIEERKIEKMKKEIMLIFLTLINISIVYAEFEMSITLDDDIQGIKNKHISLLDYDSGLRITKKIDNNGNLTFDLKELVKYPSEIYWIGATICLQDSIKCTGYPFYFYLSNTLGNRLIVNLNSTARIYFPLDSSSHPGASCSDDHSLILCSYYLYDPIKHKLLIKGQLSNGSPIDLGKSEGLNGLYFFGIYASDGKSAVLDVYPFIQKSIEIENPHETPAKAIVNLTNTSCYFEDKTQIRTFSLKPLEKKRKNISCKMDRDIDSLIEINIIKISDSNIDINGGAFLLSLFPSILGSLISYLVIFNKSKKKKRIFISILFFIIIWLLSYFLINQF